MGVTGVSLGVIKEMSYEFFAAYLVLRTFVIANL